MRWYTKKHSSPGSAVVYAHGRGMVCGNLDLYDPVVSQYVSLSRVPFLAVEYRLAPEQSGATPVEDTYTAINWLIEHSSKLGIASNRIAIMGDSAAILARDLGTPLLKHVLDIPMLDNWNIEPDSYLVPFISWTYDTNYTGWAELLGNDLASDSVSHIAVSARNTNFEGLATAYIEVGELDIFQGEDVDYATKL